MPLHRTPLRVYYEDTDAGGIVFYANYLKFAERGRTEFLRTLGFDHNHMANIYGLGFVVRRCTMEFLKPARLDDVLTVETRLSGFGGARLEMTQRVLKNDMILCTMSVTLGCIDVKGKPGKGRPGRIPKDLIAAFQAAD